MPIIKRKSLFVLAACFLVLILLIGTSQNREKMYVSEYDPTVKSGIPDDIGYELRAKGRPYVVDNKGNRMYVGRKKVNWKKFGCNTDGLSPHQFRDIKGVHTRYGQCQQDTNKGATAYELCNCEEGTFFRTDPMGNRFALCANRGRCKYAGNDKKITKLNTRPVKLLTIDYSGNSST